jgi:AraC-like DNA-binding protein
MDYREIEIPSALAGSVKTIWTLRNDGPADSWHEHDATPDGCVELIRRSSGRSIWAREQPALFVGGLIETAIRLRMSGDARFIGVRLWPWAWNRLGGAPARSFIDDWVALDENGPLATLVDTDAELPERLAAFLPAAPALAMSILASRTVSDLSCRSGLSHRALQRWFVREVGMPPQRYLRLLRFQDALEQMQSTGGGLASFAADQGYADQPHMAREFKKLIGQPATRARRNARGPFLDGSEDAG